MHTCKPFSSRILMPLFFLLSSALSSNSLADEFKSDLENESNSCWTSQPASGCNGWMGLKGITISPEKTHSGKQAMKGVFRYNEQHNETFRVVNSKHIFVRFYDYYADGFDFAAGMKIGRISSFNSATQRNDYDIILQARASGSNRCGTTDSSSLAISYNGGPVDWGMAEASFVFQRGRWYNIEVEVKLNTPGLANGEVRVWADEKLIAQKIGINITGSGSAAINRVMYGGWYSNSAGGNPCPNPAQDSIRYIDDVAISGSRIGSTVSGPIGLKNGSFELDQNSNGRPDDWTSSQYVSRSNDIASAGVYSMRHRSSLSANYAIEQTVANIIPFHSYRFDSKTYIPNTQGSFRYDLIIEWRNSTGQVLRQDYVDTFTPASSNGQWRSAGLTRTAPATAATAVIRVKMTGLNGTVYSDDFKFVDVSAP